MTQKTQTAMGKMQQIANRLISNTPELNKMLDNDSMLKMKRPNSPNSKKNKGNNPNIGYSQVGGKNQFTSNDYQQKNKELVSQLQIWKQKAINLQEEIVIIKQRFVERQIEYRKIIEQLQYEIRSKSTLDNTTDKSRMQPINELHNQIIDNIGKIQTKTSKILIQQQSDIRRFFHKKINEIKQKFKEDKINKTQKDQQYLQKEKQMMSQLEWIKNIAHKIDLENQSIVKKYTTLKSQFDIQEKDKDILLKEIVAKKKENAGLLLQVQQYEKLLNEVSREMEDNESKASDNMMNSNLQSSKISKAQKNQTKVEANSKKYQATIGHLNNVIAKQRKKIRDLKNLYMKEVSQKSDLQKTIRALIQDVRESIMQLEKEKPRRKKKENENSEFDLNGREQLLQKILTNEKILTLIYDKTFYGNKKVYSGEQEIPVELSKILQNDDEEGFH